MLTSKKNRLAIDETAVTVLTPFYSLNSPILLYLSILCATSSVVDKSFNSFQSTENSPKIIDDPEYKLDEEEADEKVTVPLTVTMLIITIYLLLGALLFHKFEEWTLVQAGYFCYITLATIGNKKRFLLRN